jgi:hypothetical protein
MKIDKNNDTLDIQGWSYGDVPLSELKQWVDTQIENGKNTVRLNISWGYYDDIDGLDIIAEKK